MEKLVFDGINKRLDEHGNKIDGIEKCLERLTAITERMDNTENDHEQRLRNLEGHSGALWDKVVMTVISSGVGGVIAYALLQLGIS